MTPIPDLLVRLRALDPVPATTTPPVSDRLGDRLAAELAGILATPGTRAPRRGLRRELRRRLHRRAGRLVVGLVALLVIGSGVAYAVGLPHDVVAAFAGEHETAGAPVPWGAHDVTLAATLPLNRGRVLQVWEAANVLNGTCEYDRLLSATGVARNLGGGCQGGYPTDSTPGVSPAPGSVVLLHQAMDVQQLHPDRISDGPTFYYGRIFEPGVTRVDLRVPGHPAIPFTLVSGSTWGVVELPTDPGGGAFDPSGITVVLRDRHGAVRSTIDMTTFTTTPCDLYRADGTVDGQSGCTSR